MDISASIDIKYEIRKLKMDITLTVSIATLKELQLLVKKI